MDTYHKKDHMEFGCNCKEEKHREGGRFLAGRLQRDLLNSKYWSGNCLKDYCFWVVNSHPLIGMFCSHPAHPLNKVERIAIFMFSCCLSMLPTALIINSMEKAVDNNVLDEANAEKIDFVLVLVCVTLPVMIWETVLTYLSIGDAYCKGRGVCCDCIAFCVKWIKNMCLFWSFICACFLAGIAAWILHGRGAEFSTLLWPLALSRLQSWVLWFPIWTFLPVLGFLWTWCVEKGSQDAGDEGESEGLASSDESDAEESEET